MYLFGCMFEQKENPAFIYLFIFLPTSQHMAFSFFFFFLSFSGHTATPVANSGKETTCNAGDAGDTGSIPGSGRSPGEGNGNTLQYSCLGNLMDREAWQAIVHGIPKSRT